jgi:hypothetical protein
VSEDGAGEFGEEALDEVESGAMLKREGEGETSARSRSEPSSDFSRDMCGMIVEDQLDSGVGRIRGVEKPEEFDELAAAMAVADEGMDLAREQVDPSQQVERAMPFILMLTREGRVNAGHPSKRLPPLVGLKTGRWRKQPALCKVPK